MDSSKQNKRIHPRRYFGHDYWFIHKGYMRHARDYFRIKDSLRFLTFNYFYSEDDCIQEIERQQLIGK